MIFHVGELQQPASQYWRGFQPDAFGYNESPTKQLPYIFCWKARHKFDVPFFCLQDGARITAQVRQRALSDVDG